MCVIILKPAKETLDMEQVEKAWNRNSAGGGFAFPKDGKLNVYKNLNKQQFLDTIANALKQEPKAPFLVHCRITTHGQTNLRNTHPFWVNDDLVFAHNGIISNVGVTATSSYSDTVMFNHCYLKHLPKDFYKDTDQLNKIADIIGYSKLVFLDKDGFWKIVKENLGEWVDGYWFSNTGYKPWKTTYSSKTCTTQDAWEELAEVLTTENDKTGMKLKTSKFCPACEDDTPVIDHLDNWVEFYATVEQQKRCLKMTETEYYEFCTDLEELIMSKRIGGSKYA